MTTKDNGAGRGPNAWGAGESGRSGPLVPIRRPNETTSVAGRDSRAENITGFSLSGALKKFVHVRGLQPTSNEPQRDNRPFSSVTSTDGTGDKDPLLLSSPVHSDASRPRFSAPGSSRYDRHLERVAKEQIRRTGVAPSSEYHEDITRASDVTVAERVSDALETRHLVSSARETLSAFSTIWNGFQRASQGSSDELSMFIDTGDHGGLVMGKREEAVLPRRQRKNALTNAKSDRETTRATWRSQAGIAPSYVVGIDSDSIDEDDMAVNRIGQGRAISIVMHNIDELDATYSRNRAEAGLPYQSSPYTFPRHLRFAAELEHAGTVVLGQAEALRVQLAPTAEGEGRRGSGMAQQRKDLLKEIADLDHVGKNARAAAERIVVDSVIRELEAKKREVSEIERRQALGGVFTQELAVDYESAQRAIADLTPLVPALHQVLA